MSLINRMLKDLEQRRSGGDDPLVRARESMAGAGGAGSYSARTRWIGAGLLVLLLAAVFIVMQKLWVAEMGVGSDSSEASAEVAATAPEIPQPTVSESQEPVAAQPKPTVVVTAEPPTTAATGTTDDPAAETGSTDQPVVESAPVTPGAEATPNFERVSLRMSDFLKSTLPLRPEPRRSRTRTAPPRTAAPTSDPGPAKRPTRSDAEIAAERDYADALAALAAGRFERAAELTRQALRSKPDFHAARETLIALHIEQGNTASAVLEAEQGMTVDFDHQLYHLLAARAELAGGDVDAALERVRATPQRSGSNVEYLVLKAAVLQRAALHEEAQHVYEELVTLDPTNGQGLVGLGVASERVGDRETALAAYRRALTLTSLDPRLIQYAESRTRALSAGGR